MKTTKWVIASIGCTGVITTGMDRYTSYGSACMMQEILESQNPYTSYLLYTEEEWEEMVKDGRAIA